MNYRTLEEYKEEVFDKLDDNKKLEWMYEMSKNLCLLEEYIKSTTLYEIDTTNIYDLKLSRVNYKLIKIFRK